MTILPMGKLPIDKLPRKLLNISKRIVKVR